MRFFKQVLIFIAVLTAVFSACKKDSDTLDTSPNFYFFNGDTSSFSRNLLLFPSSDTLTLSLTVSSTYTLPTQTVVTFAVADTSRTKYNDSHSSNYNLMPEDAYSLPDTIVMTAGKSVDTLTVQVYKNKLNPLSDYMLPIVIADAQGQKINTAGSQTIYLNYKGSSLGGLYSLAGTRIEYVGDAADNNVDDTVTLPTVKSVIPISISTSITDYADLGSNGWQYNMVIDPQTGIFSATPNAVILQSVLQDSFTMIDATYDDETKIIHLKSSYKNSSGDERIVDETLTPQ